jgi:hypothetical protein
LTDADKKEIDAMTQKEMAQALRFSPTGHRFFRSDTGEYFLKVFRGKGGMTPQISKEIGWETPHGWRIP